MRIFDFDEQFEKQDALFDQCVGWFSSCVNVMTVGRANKEEERRGIDLWLLPVDGHRIGNRIPVQVKVDFHTSFTENLAIETVGQGRWQGRWTPGWFWLLSNSHYLMYICGNTGQFRLYESATFFQEAIKRFTNRKSFVVQNGSPDGDDYWYGCGVLMPTIAMEQFVLESGNISSRIPGTLPIKTQKAAIGG